MQTLIGVLWDIVLLRRGPGELPSSWALVGALGALSFAIDLLASRLIIGPDNALLRSLVDLAITVLGFWALLVLRRRVHRAPQTLAALFGTDLLLSIPWIALALLRKGLAHGDDRALILDLLSLPLLAWGILVLAHITRSALDVPLANGIAISLSFAVLSLVVAHLLFAPASV